MPQSLGRIVVHLIFSTKDRCPFLGPEIRPSLHKFLAGIGRKIDCECFRVGGTADHVHLAVGLARTVAVADLVKELKAISSKWLKGQSPELKSFAWQRGYACFSVGPKDLDALVDYIDGQEAHHKKQSFQEEFRKFLDRYGVDYDERYVWD